MKNILKLFLLTSVLVSTSGIQAKNISSNLNGLLIVLSEEEAIKNTVASFFAALNKNDFKEARKYAVKDKDADNFFIMMENMSKTPGAKKGPIPTIKEIKVDGLKAVVSFVGQPNMKLEKEDGAWKIDVRMKKPPMPKD